MGFLYMNKIAIHWFRRDLRLYDNTALYQALLSGSQVQTLFIFDREILDKLEDKADARVGFLHQEVHRLATELQALGSSIRVEYGTPMQVWERLVEELPIEKVFTNRDYEPYAQERDKALYEFLKSKNIEFKGFKDHVIFEKNEVLKQDGTPYTVFTPYSRKWKEKLNDEHLKSYDTVKYFNNFIQNSQGAIPTLKEMGFTKTSISFPDRQLNESIIAQYHVNRDLPAIQGTTRVSLHLRFGTVSVRRVAKKGLEINEKYLNEIIWRDFYQKMIFHFPHMVANAFKSQYDRIEWEHNEVHYQAWCEGKTGYPLVDAGMRELNATGFMHNRVRMVVASFLCKHLLLDWRLGERYFAVKLLDFELASNVGGWQWASGSGNDAAPYFRVFNPQLQLEKFDKNLKYVKKWVPEYGTSSYVKPIVEHKFARQRALDRYKAGLDQAQ